MTSSPLPEGKGGSTPGGAVSSKPGEAPDPPPTKWPRWRISMLVGAVILLGAAILDAALDELPRPLYFVLFGAGYVFLAYGFFTALGAREGNSTKK